MFLAVTSPNDGSQPDELNNLLDYIAGGDASGDLPERMDDRVRDVIGSTEWRREYMLLEWRDQDNVEKGRKEAEEWMGELFSALLSQGRTDDAAKAATDPQERVRLSEELGIEIPTGK